MRTVLKIVGLLLIALTTACGGGGGSAGGTGTSGSGSTGSTTTTVVIGTPTLAIQLFNSSNTAVSNVTSGGGNYVRATFKNSSGTAIVDRLVTFTLSGTAIASLSSTTALTNASGEARVSIAPLPGTAGGAATVTALALDGTVSVSKSADFSVAAAGGPTGAPTLTVGLRDASNAPTTSISGGGVSTASATLLDADGKAVVNRLVGFVADAALVKLNPLSGSVLTDSNGVASIQISALSLQVSGASTLKATAQVGTSTYSGSFDYQVSRTNLALQSLSLGSSALAAYGNRAVSVQVTANGLPVTTPVQVSFVASCGSITATANTDASGFASATYKADSQNCAGTNVNISASTVGATALSGQIAVQPTAATNIQFVSTAPTLIYLRDSGAATQALVTFRVVDSNGNPQQNQAIALSFVNSSPGVSMDTIGNTSTITKTSDAAGIVSVAVFSGTVPTPVQVRATLVANVSVTTTSGLLTVATGRPVQRAASIASVKLSLEGFNFDGDTTPITLSIADRQGNPVPDGTVVNFVSQSGVMIPPACVITGGTSQCSSTIRTQGTRPANGRISVLAYVQGEKDFVDANFNNVYDPGEAFTDLGNAYRSDANDKLRPSDNAKSSSWTYRLGEFSVPRGDASGYVTCAGGESGRPDTCDGKWGAVDVRKQHMVIFATSTPSLSDVTGSTGGISLTLSDLNGNSMPTGTVLEASKISGSDECNVKTVGPTPIPNTYDPVFVVITLDKCVVNDVIQFTVTTPVTRTKTAFNFRLP
jgi:hypothetical protein